MDIEFIVQDTYALTRPQWKLATNLEEASRAFQMAIAQDQKNSGLDKVLEQDDGTSGPSSDDGEGDGDDLNIADVDDDEDVESDEDDDHDGSHVDSDSEDEAIVVTREEEEVNPEDEAEFEREYAKMMAESLDSRKFDRKPLFDVPLPMRTKNQVGEGPVTNAPGTMAFSLLTKRGNRQQVSIKKREKKSVIRFADCCGSDSDRGAPVRFELCHRHEKPAGSGARRAAAYQKPGAEPGPRRKRDRRW